MKLEVNFDLGGPDNNFKLTREKYCDSIEKEYEKFLESPNSPRNGFFVSVRCTNILKSFLAF